MKEVSLRAVCTASGIHAKALGEKIAAAYCASDYRDVLKDEEINAVLIGTRHGDHGQMVVESLRAGKHVFVEKPLCLSEEALEEITAVYEAKATEGIQLMVGFNRRFSPHMAQARALFQDRKNPLVMLYRVNAGAISPDHWVHDPEIGGGRILGEACHFIDCMQALCGSVPTSVHARRIDHHTSGITEDQSLLSFSFADGSIGTVIYAAGGDTALAKERFEAFGEGKAVIIDDFIKTESFSGGKGNRFKTTKQDKGFQMEMTRFVEAIQGGTPAMSFAEIQAVTKATLRAVESFRTGAVYALERVDGMANLKWMVKRLRVMGPTEIAHRIGEQWTLKMMAARYRMGRGGIVSSEREFSRFEFCRGTAPKLPTLPIKIADPEEIDRLLCRKNQDRRPALAVAPRRGRLA
ncbi:MAG: Gfo/Idh/MocA family oxidoreductase [Candidatus Manganitrophus sp.]|nr:Gfo/Idh/MocA family oxidoreductase [Candidatus Manganitrophus sp.]